jgi:hypothetical protein
MQTFYRDVALWRTAPVWEGGKLSSLGPGAPVLVTPCLRLVANLAESGIMQGIFGRFWGNLSPGPSKRSGSGAWHAPCSPAASLSQELPLFPPARAPGLAREHRTGQKRAFWEGKSIFSSKPRVQRPRSEASGTRARSSRPQHRKIGLSSQKQKGLCSRRKTAPGDTVAERALLANVRCVLLSFGCELRWVSKESKSPLQGASFEIGTAVPVAQKFGEIRNPPSSEHLLGRNPRKGVCSPVS